MLIKLILLASFGYQLHFGLPQAVRNRHPLFFQLLDSLGDRPQLCFLLGDVRALFNQMLNGLLNQRQQSFGILDQLLFVHRL